MMRFASTLLFLVVFSLTGLLAADSEPEKSEDKSAAAEKTEANAGDDAFLKDIPLGETFEGIRIPQLNPNGRLLMLFDAKSATRVDDQHIAMTGLKIEIHNDDNTTFHVAMDESVFDLDTRILTSDTPVNIRRDDFVIDGDTAEFHTKTRFGKVIGNVKMVIFNTDNIE